VSSRESAADGGLSLPHKRKTSYVTIRVAAAAVNGQFIARISRGRKIGEVVLYSLILPAAYGLVWFCIWGGIGLRQERQAEELKMIGERYFNGSAHFLANGSALCYDVPQSDVVFRGDVVFTNHLPGVSPVCEFDADHADTAVYHVLSSFTDGRNDGINALLPLFFMVTSTVLFIAGASVATLFADRLSLSGRIDNSPVRRVFWTITIGAMATVLLTSAGKEALPIVRAAMILCGVPCAIVVCYAMQSATLLCAAADKVDGCGDYQFPDQPEFAMPVYGGLFNILEYTMSFGFVNQQRVEAGMDRPTTLQIREFLKGVFVPFASLYQVLTATYPQNPVTNMAGTALFAVVYIVWFVLLVLSGSYRGTKGLLWTSFVVKGVFLAVIRSGFRARYNLRSNCVADVVSSILFWPQVMTQMRLHCLLISDSAPT
jgi:BCCT, betaine/carnitine/choline family transporter